MRLIWLWTPKRLIWLGFVVRLAVAAWNGFFGPSLGADGDAVTFHAAAVAFSRGEEVARFGVIGWTHTYFLGWFYRLIDDSLFFGSLLSCIAWVGAAVLLRKSMRILAFPETSQSKALLIFALLPSSILFTSVTLREVYQLLAVNGAVYAALKILIEKQSVYWVLLLLAAAAAGVLHMALVPFAVYFPAATFIFLVVRGNIGWTVQRFGATVVLFAAALVLAYVVFNQVGFTLERGLIAGVQEFQRTAMTLPARTQYKVNVDFGGILGFVLLVLASLLQYLVEPLPWRHLIALDLPVIGENVIRGGLLFVALTRIRDVPREYRGSVELVVVSYLVIETLWCLGTTNWGTAIRHHVPALGVLMLGAFAYSSVPRTSAVRPAAAA